MAVCDIFTQFFAIPKPPITEHSCPDQTGRVIIVTGGYAGVGFELSKMLAGAGATVYLAGRSRSKAEAAIDRITLALPKSPGRVKFMHVDFSDLPTIQPGVKGFLEAESRLDVLVNNAGVMFPAAGSTDAQGEDLQIGTNCVGPYLLHKLLAPILAKTASMSPAGAVRVTWAGSSGLDLLSPRNGGMDLDGNGRPRNVGVQADYGQSKAANLFFARHFARRTPETGVVHLCFNPGNLRTELQRHSSGIGLKVVDALLLYPAIFGAYTELWAVVAPDVTVEKSGAYVWPWGRFGRFRKDLETSMKLPSEGGTGVAAKFIAWCEERTAPYAH